VYRSNLSYKTLRCSCLLNLLLTGLADEAKQRDVKNDQIIENVLALITNHPHKFYSISELVKFAGICSKSLTAHFKRATGQSVHKYQIETKLEQVAILLQNGSFSSLKALSINFGFYDEYHLNTCFKKKFGISPVRYSKQFEYGLR
jgi:AraC-like DNA-binding protein